MWNTRASLLCERCRQLLKERWSNPCVQEGMYSARVAVIKYNMASSDEEHDVSDSMSVRLEVGRALTKLFGMLFGHVEP